jgi:protein-S-isoprenylcysteine O-methyltransferase Ste14
MLTYLLAFFSKVGAPIVNFFVETTVPSQFQTVESIANVSPWWARGVGFLLVAIVFALVLVGARNLVLDILY